MTKFIDGPAGGKTLELLRVPMPYFLRVVQDQDSEVDALDQLDDEPAMGETLYLYVKILDNGTVHIDGRDKKGKRFGKWYNPCEYALYATQPDQETMRDRAKWVAWCKAEYERVRK